MNGALGTELELLEDVAAKDDADAGARDRCSASEHRSFGFTKIELGFKILWQKHDES